MKDIGNEKITLNSDVNRLNESTNRWLRIGIIGTGRIASRFMEEAKLVNGLLIQSAFNPHKECADRFEKNYEVKCFSLNFNEFLEAVDAVYIASPNETHFCYAKSVLESGRHVLCEKPLAFSRIQAEELFNLAEKNELVLMEGIKTAYCPGFVLLMDVANSGIIGEIRDIEACFSRITSPELREMTDTEFGGAFMEFGNYTILPVFKLLGTDYKTISYESILADNRIDLYTKLYFRYNQGMALSKTGIGVKSEGLLLIAGTKGYIIVESPWWLTRRFQVRYEDPTRIDQYTSEFEGDGLRYEIKEFISRINGNPSSNYALSTKETIAMAAIVEGFMDNRRETERIFLTNNRNSGIKIWAHRGCSYRYPENTIPAFVAACNLPEITGIELDIQLTADNEIVVIHDETVDRVTYGNGYVREFSLAALQQLVFKGVEKEAMTVDVRIPTMKEILRIIKPYCISKGLLINIELKNNKFRYEGMEEKILSLISEYDMQAYVVYSSFNVESLCKLKELDSRVSVGILKRRIEECINFGKDIPSDIFHPSIEGLETDVILPQNVVIRVWNEKEPFFGQNKGKMVFDLESLRKKGVTDIITNMPELYLG